MSKSLFAAAIPSDQTMLLERDLTFIVTRYVSFEILFTVFILLRNSFLFCTKDGISVTTGCRWKPTNSDIFDVGLFIELTAGIPGLPSLLLLGVL